MTCDRRALRRVGAASACAMIAAAHAGAQLVVGFDRTTAGATTCYARDMSTGQWTPLFANRQVWGMAADDARRTLYISSNGNALYAWSYDQLGAGTPPTFVTQITVGGVSASMAGLAYDSLHDVLYGSRTTPNEGIYEINPESGAATLVLDVADNDYSIDGLDYNPIDGLLYGTDDAAPGGTGLVRLDVAAQTATIVAPYPTFSGDGGAVKDIDGLAIGVTNGIALAFLTPDQPGQIGVMNLSTLLAETPVSNPFTTSETFSGATWAASLFAPGDADVSVTLTDAPDPVVPVTSAFTLTCAVHNAGPAGATGVMLVCAPPPGVTFESVQSPGVLVDGAAIADLGTMLQGASRTIAVTARASAAGEFATQATVSAANDFLPGNNGAIETTRVRDPQADLRVVVAPPACIASAESPVAFEVAVRNLSPAAADACTAARVVVTLPANAEFVQSQPAGTMDGGLLTVDLGAVAAGATRSVIVTVQPAAVEPISLAAEADSELPDPDPANNAASATATASTAPPAAVAVGIASTIAAQANSAVPGVDGVRFTALGRPFASPNGSRWIAQAQTSASAATNSVLVAFDGAALSLVAREGVTVLPTAPGPSGSAGPFHPFGAFDATLSISDDGRFAFSGVDDRAGTLDDGYVARWNGTAFQIVAQESVTPAPPVGPGVTFGSVSGSARLAVDGSVAFMSSFAGPGVSATNDTGLFVNSGATLLAREGVTTPTGQVSGPFALKSFDSGDTLGLGFAIDATGAHYIASAAVDASSTAPPTSGVDRVIVVDGAVVVQENVPIAGTSFTSPAADATPFRFVDMTPSGEWLAIGSNRDGQEWVLRATALTPHVAAASGEPIAAGAERWIGQFFLAALNSAGDIAVGGRTDAGSARADHAIVLNGARVLLRENDPVDLDANGLFDDRVYVRSFGVFAGFLSETELVVVVGLRDESAALCGGADLEIGQALLRVPLLAGCAGGPSCDAADVNGDCRVDLVDLATLLSHFGTPSGATRADGDLSGDGAVDLTDLATLLVSFGHDCSTQP